MSVRIGYEGFDFPEADAKSLRGNWANMLCWFPKKDWKGDGDCGGFIVFLMRRQVLIACIARLKYFSI